MRQTLSEPTRGARNHARVEGYQVPPPDLITETSLGLFVTTAKTTIDALVAARSESTP